MSSATTSQGCQLKRGDGAGSETFTLIGEIRELTGPAVKSNMIDVTSLDSTAKEFINGLDDGGEVSGTMNWVAGNTQQQGLYTDQQNRTVRNFKLVLNDSGGSAATTIAFSAIVVGFGPWKIGVDKQVEVDFSLKVTGNLTITYAS